LFATLLLAACGRSVPAVETEMTPVAGGMAAPADAARDTGAEPDADSPSAPAEEAPVIAEVGSRVVLIAAAGAPLRADAGEAALTLQRYPVGETMEVVEPSGDYAAYPVTVEDRAWYRVRAADGLVGWIAADAVESAE
jgi:hypothetical protein